MKKGIDRCKNGFMSCAVKDSAYGHNLQLHIILVLVILVNLNKFFERAHLIRWSVNKNQPQL